jgi:hypothetical protein
MRADQRSPTDARRSVSAGVGAARSASSAHVPS